MAKHSPRFLKLAEDARGTVRELSIQDLKLKMGLGQVFHLLDVREDHEWAAGHLPRAAHLGRGILERDIEQRIADTAAEIVLYCGGGYRSALAAQSLQAMGYQNVWSLAGGFRAWREAGFEVDNA